MTNKKKTGIHKTGKRITDEGILLNNIVVNNKKKNNFFSTVARFLFFANNK